MLRSFLTAFIILFPALVFAQVSVINQKGTRIGIDSSKWLLSGTDLINKNTGNVGIGTVSPTYKLDVTGKVKISDSLLTNTLRILTLTSGNSNTDSILVTDPASGLMKRISANQLNKADSTSASNGLTLTGKDVRLGGSLSGATTITQGANSLSFTSSAVNGFSVDGTTFSVDGTNNRVGIGTASPATVLEVNSGTAGTSGVRLTNLTSASTTSTGTTLGVNSTGDLVTISVPIVTKFVLGTSVSSSSVTRANISGWSFTVTSGNTYKVEIFASYQTTALTTGGSLGFILPSGAGNIQGYGEGEVSVSNTVSGANGVATGLRQTLRAISSSSTTAGSVITTSGVGTVSTPHYIGAQFVFNCTTTGSLQVQWGSEIGSSAATLNANSVMVVTEY